MSEKLNSWIHWKNMELAKGGLYEGEPMFYRDILELKQRCEDYRQKVAELERQKEAYRMVANRIENEWRKRETWIGEKRPEMILFWIDSEAKKIWDGK